MDENDKPIDVYAAVRVFAISLERQGIEAETIVDALIVTAVNAAERLNGAEAVALALQDLAADMTGMVRNETGPTLTVH